MHLTQILGTRPYIVTIFKNGEMFKLTKFMAKSRKQAINKALFWFWNHHKKLGLGKACDSIVVDDLYCEVRYTPDFRCDCRHNNFLPQSTINRVIQESKGELVQDMGQGPSGPSHNSLRRVRRRRMAITYPAPGIRRMANGVMYYKVNLPEKTSIAREKGWIRSKFQEVRLEARNLPDAIKEIEAKGLHLRNAEGSICKMPVRDLRFTAHVAGVITLSREERKHFASVLPRYEKPRSSRPKVS